MLWGTFHIQNIAVCIHFDDLYWEFWCTTIILIHFLTFPLSWRNPLQLISILHSITWSRQLCIYVLSVQICLFWIFHRRILQYMTFCDQLILLRVMRLRPICDMLWFRTSLLLWLSNILPYRYTTFYLSIYPLTETHINISYLALGLLGPAVNVYTLLIILLYSI